MIGNLVPGRANSLPNPERAPEAHMPKVDRWTDEALLAEIDAEAAEKSLRRDPERWPSTQLVSDSGPSRARLGRTHGLYATYTNGCHCKDCRSAAAEWHRRHRQRQKREGDEQRHDQPR